MRKKTVGRHEDDTRIERIGKNSGVSICGTPKYLHARAESNLEYAALAGSVQGGLFPVQSVSDFDIN